MTESCNSMKQGFHGYSSSAVLKHFFDRNVGEVTGARTRIVTTCVDLYLSNTIPAQRQIRFHQAKDYTDIHELDAALKANKQLINRFLDPEKSASLKDEFGHFLAQSLDEPYRTECIQTIKNKFWNDEPLGVEQGEVDHMAEFQGLLQKNNTAGQKYFVLLEDWVVDHNDCPMQLNEAVNALTAMAENATRKADFIRGVLEKQRLKVVEP